MDADSIKRLFDQVRARKVSPLTFREYLRVGVPLTILSLVAGAALL